MSSIYKTNYVLVVIFILIFLFNSALIFQSKDFLDGSWLPSIITTTKNCWTEYGFSIKITLSSYVVRKTRDFSISANVIVLFLLWVMKNVMLICLKTVLPQFI